MSGRNPPQNGLSKKGNLLAHIVVFIVVTLLLVIWSCLLAYLVIFDCVSDIVYKIHKSPDDVIPLQRRFIDLFSIRH